MLFDIHVHSNYSACSDLSVQDILSLSRSRGLDGVCITDHHCMRAEEKIAAAIQEDGLCVIIGQEYSTPQGDFLLFGPYENLPQGLGAVQLLKHVRSSKGCAISAHPFRCERPTKEDIINSGLCNAIEGVNNRNTWSENYQTIGWLQDYPLVSLGGSDAHSLEELGKVATWFNMPIRSRSDLINAINSGQTVCCPCYPESSKLQFVQGAG